MVCHICENVQTSELNATGEENKILQCVKCKIKVHQLCYGVSVQSDKTIWVCSFCTAYNSCTDKKRMIKKCVLCPKKTGAFKPTKCGKMVHIICALFHPNCSFENVDTMEPIHVSPIQEKRRQCAICRLNIRGCVKCFAKGCYNYLHVTCAQEHQTLREEKNADGESINFRLYCKKHIKDQPKIRLSLEHIKQHVISRRSNAVGVENYDAKSGNDHGKRGGRNDGKSKETFGGGTDDYGTKTSGKS